MSRVFDRGAPPLIAWMSIIDYLDLLPFCQLHCILERVLLKKLFWSEFCSRMLFLTITSTEGFLRGIGWVLLVVLLVTLVGNVACFYAVFKNLR